MSVATILVIDDSPPVLATVQKFLESAGYRVLTSSNPMLAANVVRQEQPNLVLVDVDMPGLSGDQVVDTLKKFDCCPGTPLVLFSALDESRLAELCGKVGADGWICKGSQLKAGTLVRQVREFVVQRPRPQRGAALVVDDSRAMRSLLGSILQDLGLDVTEASHGRDALRRIKPGLRVALVDLNMPEMNGYEFVQRVRGLSDYDQMQILMVTSESDMTQIQRLLQAGANEYVLKPFSKEAIIDKLRMLGVVAA